MSKKIKPDEEYLALARFIMQTTKCPCCHSTVKIEQIDGLAKPGYCEKDNIITCNVCGTVIEIPE